MMLEKTRRGFWYFIGLLYLSLINPIGEYDEITDEQYEWFCNFRNRHGIS